MQSSFSMTNEIMYWHIHALLGVFTLFLIIDFLKEQNYLFKTIGIYFLSFIVIVAFIQSIFWDNFGAKLGLWVFNPKKSVELAVFGNLLPVEEVLWIIHHSFMAILFQMKIFAIIPRNELKPLHYSNRIIWMVNILLVLMTIYGFYTVIVSNQINLKISSLLSLFFAPLFMFQWFFGHRFLRQNHKRVLLGVAIPSIYTTILDALAQHHCIWSFPLKHTHNINVFGINFDVFLIYTCTTFACTLGYAIIQSVMETMIFESKNNNSAINVSVYNILSRILIRKPNGI